ncbi:hisS [Symbiodinium sp. CCMP2592]|nr:hisS [Symbiodinium sp. CCMP2592]
MAVDALSGNQQFRLSEAVSTIQEVAYDLNRRLQTECDPDSVDLSDAHNIAQICQGVGFISLAMWLIFANNSKVAVAQKAPLEQRHAICATISTAVALFSGFFNILQLTAIDDFDLPGRANNFTLNLSRPIEWIATCPIMQLKLVVLAGARVPSYRRFMMPLICVSVLLCGTASMFTGDALRYAWYAFGMFLALVMFYHNALQIRENSEGEESILQGDSDFRKLSILLIVTWFPFPLWFCLSVEGWGVITDYLVIEMGWVVLNIVSKFTFIIWMQRMKMVHGKKLEAARELYGLSPSDHVDEEDLKKKAKAQGGGAVGLGGVCADKYGLGAGEEADSEQKLVEVISETMVTLGMSTHTDRLLKLLVENGVTNTAVLERLNGERCMELNLPWALIDAAQKRWIAEKMNMGQDQGGQIEKEDPFKKILEANKERMTGKQLVHGLPGMPGGVNTPPLSNGMSGLMGMGDEEALAAAVSRAMMPFQDSIMTKMHMMEEAMQRHLEAMQEAISQRMDFSQVSLLQTVNACQVLLHKLDSSQEAVIQKMDTQKTTVDQMVNSYGNLVTNIAGASESTKSALLDTVNTSSSALLKKLDATQQDLLKQSHESHAVLEGVAASQTTLAKKVDSGNEFTQRRLVDMEGCIERKMSDVSDSLSRSQTQCSDKMLSALRGDLATLQAQGNAMAVATEKSSNTQEERMADVRRQNMMIMDMLTNAQETMHSSAESLQSFTRAEIMRDSAANMEMQLREVIVKQMNNLQEAFLGEGDEGAKSGSFKAAVGSMVDRLEEVSSRLELASAASNAQADSKGGSVEMEELIRRELAAVAMALSQQQRETAQENLVQVGQTVRSEMMPLKDATISAAGTVDAKVNEMNESLSQSMTRFELGIDKVLQTVDSAKGAKDEGKRGGRGSSDRG